MEQLHINQLVEIIRTELLSELQIASIDPHDPVVVHHLPAPWQLVGAGNYAAVLCHPNYPEVVVKIYAPSRPGFEEELEVYRRLGAHPAFSQCFYGENGVLVLKRLYGVTLYDCLSKGLQIPKQVIQDIDAALEYARSRGLYPHDVHGRNVMMYEGRGLVVDISDFLHLETCSKWDHLKQAYYWLYLPLFYPLRLKVPYFLLNIVRKSYRLASSSIIFMARLVRQTFGNRKLLKLAKK
ncbi:serine/threonine protein kinase [Aerosakkonemataceae cyanobacterium BLCC-F154]|uniref:Serine/threonine protein kinase n=1 Tax=Floridaenema fluviatile BLCC-F154 TaxID=3153640 RepID=A0ABV4YJ53_9CYAN